MNFIQGTIQQLEVGKASVIVRIAPLVISIFALIVLLDFGGMQIPGVISIGGNYHGLNDAQSMDNAQVARQIVRGHGFTTKFIRPHAVAQLRDFAVNRSMNTGGSRDLFPSDKFPPGTPRVLPDTYNAPGFPYVLAGWFALIHPDFDEAADTIANKQIYAPDRWIPPFNQIFLLGTAVLVFVIARRLFDSRVAWMALMSCLVTNLFWRYSLTGLSTTFVTFLVTAAFYCMVEIFAVSELCFESEERSFAPAAGWGAALFVLLAGICITRMDMLVLIVPFAMMLLAMPIASVMLAVGVVLAAFGSVVPWMMHLHAICGSFFGSNAPLVLHGIGEYKDNQVFCTTAIPSYERLFGDAVSKEYNGYLWSFEHAWSLLGSNPMILFFGASILHQFKRRRTRLFHWMLFVTAVVVVGADSLGEAKPSEIDPWNALIILAPAMLTVGSAYFFILLDRMGLQLWLLNHFIVGLFVLLNAAPLLLGMTNPPGAYFTWPPYSPPLIRSFAGFTQPDEWVTTDMPWATAWYGDRASLWLPDSITDFENFHDNVCPTGIILFTPVSWDRPFDDFRNGEDKDWFPYAAGLGAAENFPLQVHVATPGKIPDYMLWSDRPRWQTQ
jgi:hypothetical protein